MTPLVRLRLQKAAADCGFEMTSIPQHDGLMFCSARFPETVLVRVTGEQSFELSASDPSILDVKAGSTSLSVEGYGGLYALLRSVAAHARTKPNRVADAFKKQTASMPKTTEAERLVVQRVGQALFWNSLLDYWDGKCAVSGFDIPELLRASHIRPWAECESDEQRLDVFNGLLLVAQLDALFDVGLMTVEEGGTIRLSTAVTPTHQGALGITRPLVVKGLRPEHQRYLEFHRAKVWRG